MYVSFQIIKMISLPIEVQLRILKYLNFNELITVKQTNSYFCNLISKYEGELAQRKFFELSIINENQKPDSYKYNIAPESGVFEFTLNDQLREKLQAAIDVSIPVFLSEHDIKPLVCIKTLVDYRYYLLKLPTIPKNIEEMIIVRCWLEKLFKCSFDHCDFDKIVFNPEMLNILFYNDKTILPKFHVDIPSLSPTNRTFENMVDFILNHLENSSFFIIDFTDIENVVQYKNILFDIIINEGDKFPRFSLRHCKLTTLYDTIMEYITTTKDSTKIIAFIQLYCMKFPNFRLPERAENVQIGEYDVFNRRYTRYEIANIYDPRMRFAFSIADISGSISCIDIIKINV
uniref:F-box domain-containing protein n=1 Tax=Meloidogyne enterolobii TaxID=390850 RepID=A0A6V7VZF9_MELEN|nr:unnamed protein product [Meloidogyne enterolobii]